MSKLVAANEGDPGPPEDRESQKISFEEFLEAVPPGVPKQLSRFAVVPPSIGPANREIARPAINLFCSDQACDRIQVFENTDSHPIQIRPSAGFDRPDGLLHYRCRNCHRVQKIFALRVLSHDGADGELVKVGEWPPFGPPLPARLQRLVQSDRDLLLKGFRSENSGFGIGAFAYYRRIVEDAKTELIDQMIAACKRIAGGASFIPRLEEARTQTQFSGAVEKIADAIPDVLRIDTQNPLAVLHKALSRKIHAESDEECLAAAHAIRAVLAALLEKLAAINKEDAEVTNAIRRVMKDAGNSNERGA
jgi:hypothetical protein